MDFGSDKRAQSTLVGAILLFAILIIAFSSYQAFVVPNQNAEVEFNHNQNVQTDLQDLRNSLLSVRSVERVDEGDYEIVSEHRPTRVRIGTQYPERLVALNPPSPTGQLGTEDPGSEVSIENAEVVNPSAFDGDPEALLDDFESTGFETRFISYEPGYNEYRNAPETTFEHSLLYNQFDDADLVVRDQRLINDRRLNVVLFSGDISQASGQATTLDPETLDGPTAPINISASNDNIEFTIPTERPELWADEDVIGGEFGEGATRARVPNPNAADDRVTIELEADETYQLRVARVGFDGGAEENEFTPIQLEDAAAAPGEGTELLPGPRVFNADEDADDPLVPEDEFTLSADVSSVGQTNDERGGTTIQNAEWYLEGDDPGLGNANEMEADGGYLNDVEVGVEDEVSTNDLEEGDNTIIIRGQDSRGIWGEDTDSVTVTVKDEEKNGGAQTMAERTELATSGSFGGAQSELRFTLENTGSSNSVITDITFDSTDTDAEFIDNQEGGDTFRTESGDTLFADRIDLNNQESINELSISGGNQVTVELGQFRDGDDNPGRINMDEDQASITFTFDDGSQDTYDITG